MKLRDELREKQRMVRVERAERFEQKKKEVAEERMRSFNEYNGSRRRSPPRRVGVDYLNELQFFGTNFKIFQ